MPNTIVQIGSAIVPGGARELGPFSIQAGEGQFHLLLDSTQHLNSGVTVDVQIHDSMDGGETWNFRAGGIRTGGTYTGEDGEPITNFDMTANIPQPENDNRKVKIKLIVTGGSLVTSGGSLSFAAS